MTLEEIERSPAFKDYYERVSPTCKELLDIVKDKGLLSAVPIKQLSATTCIVNLAIISLFKEQVEQDDLSEEFDNAVSISMKTMRDWLDIDIPTVINDTVIQQVTDALLAKALTTKSTLIEDNNVMLKTLMQVACLSAIGSAYSFYHNIEYVDEEGLTKLVAVGDGLNQALIEVLDQYADHKDKPNQ